LVISVKFLPSLQQNFTNTRCSSCSFIVTLSLIRRTACARAQFIGFSSTANVHSQTGQMSVCCHKVPLGALSRRSAPSVLVGALLKKWGLFFFEHASCNWVQTPFFKGKLCVCYQNEGVVSILTDSSLIPKHKQEKIHNFKLIVFKEYPEIFNCVLIFIYLSPHTSVKDNCFFIERQKPKQISNRRSTRIRFRGTKITPDSNTTVRSRFATVRFRMIHFYDLYRVGPSAPDLWCTTLATQASFLYLVRL
jgi:hypothetical protein